MPPKLSLLQPEQHASVNRTHEVNTARQQLLIAEQRWTNDPLRPCGAFAHTVKSPSMGSRHGSGVQAGAASAIVSQVCTRLTHAVHFHTPEFHGGPSGCTSPGPSGAFRGVCFTCALHRSLFMAQLYMRSPPTSLVMRSVAPAPCSVPRNLWLSCGHSPKRIADRCQGRSESRRAGEFLRQVPLQIKITLKDFPFPPPPVPTKQRARRTATSVSSPPFSSSNSHSSGCLSPAADLIA